MGRRSALLMICAVCCTRAQQNATTVEIPPVNINVTNLAHHVGEAAVGLSCGAIGAWILRKAQGAVVTLGLLGSIGTIAALHLKWVSVDQVQAVSLVLTRFFSQKLREVVGFVDLDEDGELTLEDSRIAYSRVAPLVRRHPALSGGAVGGFAAVLGALR
eukprot:CAMPEP_0115866542 /NCGR_PEP_ID=MMETSP0287-20121206/20303_1 /TAXON_ID=412157 /ORGANISM="Chrysochromulina rotalis, Strain UIO044" /LENGTH=158 /DNA_ID=CAMNT_0003321113 /DNA_START=40 /DNA_END=516 /DNA_ORIENTATION=-